MPKLLILTGPQSGEIIDIQSEHTFLSIDDALKVHVNSPQIGSIKTKLTFQADQQLYYLHPGNQIAINSEGLSKPQSLGHGDFICLGAIQILFDEDQQASMSDTHTNQPSAPLEQQIKFTSHKTFTDADSIVTGMMQSKDQEWAKRRLASLFKVTSAIAQVVDAPQLFEELVDIIFLEFLAERCLILLRENSTGEIKIILCRDRAGKSLEKPQISKTILAEVLDKKSSVLTEDALKDVRFETHLSIAEHEIHSLMAVPLMSKNHVYGMIQVDTTTTSRAFKTGDLEMLAGIGMQASAALEKFELEQIKTEKEKLEKDLKLAGEVQRFLLPAQIPKIPHLNIALKYQLSQHLGGDYYDFIDKGNGLWAIILADVSGHSTASALVMAMARTVLRHHCRQYHEPAEILEKSNKIIKEDTTAFMYLTAFLMIYDSTRQVIVYSGAGHPFPLLQRDSRLIRLNKGGRPLGLMKNSNYEQQSLSLKAGDRFLIYTDGVTEAKNKKNEHFGEENLIRCLKKVDIQQEVSSLVYQLNQDLFQFIGTDKFEDDLTIMALQQN